MKIIEGTIQELIAYMKWHEGREDLVGEKQYTTPANVLDYIGTHQKPVDKTSPEDEIRLPDMGRSLSLANSVQPQTILPTRAPPKERTAKLEAIFRDYINAGLNAMTIQEHLVKEHDIAMNGHQIAGWLGRMKQQEKKKEEYQQAIKKVASLVDPRIHVDAPPMTKKADKTNPEGNCSGQGEKVAKVTTENVSKGPACKLGKCPANEQRIDFGIRASPDKKKVDDHIMKWHMAGDLDIDISQRLRRADVNMPPVEVAKRIKELKG